MFYHYPLLFFFFILINHAFAAESTAEKDSKNALSKITNSMPQKIKTLKLGDTNETALEAITNFGDSSLERGVESILLYYHELDTKIIENLQVLVKPYDTKKVNKIVQPFEKEILIIYPDKGSTQKEDSLITIERIFTEYAEIVNTAYVKLVQTVSSQHGTIAEILGSVQARSKTKNLIQHFGILINYYNTVFTNYAHMIADDLQHLLKSNDLNELPGLIIDIGYTIQNYTMNLENDYIKRRNLSIMQFENSINKAEISNKAFQRFVRALPIQKPNDNNKFNNVIHMVSNYLGNNQCSVDDLHADIVAPNVNKAGVTQVLKKLTLCIGLFTLQANYQLSTVLSMTQENANQLESLSPEEFIQRYSSIYSKSHQIWKNKIASLARAIVSVIQAPNIRNSWQISIDGIRFIRNGLIANANMFNNVYSS